MLAESYLHQIFTSAASYSSLDHPSVRRLLLSDDQLSIPASRRDGCCCTLVYSPLDIERSSQTGKVFAM